MSVLVDTPIWSFALRRKSVDLSSSQHALLDEWRRLVQARQVILIGPVRQEILSGIRHAASFNRVRLRLRAFVDESLTTEDFEDAARCSNRFRTVGITQWP